MFVTCLKIKSPYLGWSMVTRAGTPALAYVGLLTAWTGCCDPREIEPHLAFQMVNESALCLNGLRRPRTLRQRGFETLNGLPFIATDPVIHTLLDHHTITDAEAMQVALGQIRHAHGHFPSTYFLLDRTGSPRGHNVKPPRKNPTKQHLPEKYSRHFLQLMVSPDNHWRWASALHRSPSRRQHVDSLTGSRPCFHQRNRNCC